MKKVIVVFLSVLCLFTGCGKSSLTTTEKIAKHYNEILNANDTSIIRTELAELETLTKNNTISTEEQMFAQFSYNIAYGIIKLALSGKSISVFDFPGIEILSGAVDEIIERDLDITDTMVSESFRFVNKVERFLK